jgi:glycosyltransferase involved in cell wall biosynthesis
VSTERPLRVLWEGAQFAPTSLALVNRAICSRLLERGSPRIELSCRLLDRAELRLETASDPRFSALAARCNDESVEKFDLEIRHRWPPRFDRSQARRLVLIQPWEFGSIPRHWPAAIESVVDELWVPTRYVAECFRSDGVDPRRLRVIPNGVDVERFHPGHPARRLPTTKSCRLLFVGGTIGRKGIRVLLEGYRRAFRAEDDVCLVIKDLGRGSIYEGSTERDLIRAAVEDPRGPEVLHLEETLAPSELPALYAACDALVHPYLGEGFGLPIAEAMAMEMPVVVTGLGASEDFVDEKVGWPIRALRQQLPEARIGQLATCRPPWIAAPDVDDLAQKLRSLVANPAEAARRGRRGRQRILEAFSWDAVADRVANRIGDLALSEARGARIA